MAARMAADGKWVRRSARTVADVVGATEWLEMGEEKKAAGDASLAARTAADGKWLRRIARTAADGVGAREWLEMGWPSIEPRNAQHSPKLGQHRAKTTQQNPT